ncbi:hypothetical protein LP420_19335 [Massilia sp. B-10]|nr:hypothetical protein LP420_19335 [Massilia sp. B-10]
MQLHAERCSSDWGDVPYDGRYQFKASSAGSERPGQCGAGRRRGGHGAGLSNGPTRKELKDNWDAVSTATVSGKALTVLIKRGAALEGSPYSHTEAAVFVIDNPAHGTLNGAELAKSPLKVVDIPLPPRLPTRVTRFRETARKAKTRTWC